MNGPGPGPWFAVLLGDGRSVVGHTYPHKAGATVHCQVGPFDVWADCVAFVTQWRNVNGSSEGGASLCAYYGRTHRLRFLSVQGQTTRVGKNIRTIKAGCIKPKKQYR